MINSVAFRSVHPRHWAGHWLRRKCHGATLLVTCVLFLHAIVPIQGCRWAILASQDAPSQAEVLVSRTSHSLARQSFAAPRTPWLAEGKFYSPTKLWADQWTHLDGWGIGAYDLESKRPIRFRSEVGAVNETSYKVNPDLERVARNTSSHILMAHIRASSDGDPHEVNSHPFVFDQLLWMHHGGWTDRDALESMLDKENIKPSNVSQGVTDSEYMGTIFASHLGGHVCERSKYTMKELCRAMVETINDLQDLSDKVDAPSSLNFAVSDGRHLIATRYRTNDEDPPALYYSIGSKWNETTEKFDILAMPDSNRQNHHILQGSMLLIASEPLAHEFENKGWQLLIKDQMLTYDVQTGHMRLYCLSERCVHDYEFRRHLYQDCSLVPSPLLQRDSNE